MSAPFSVVAIIAAYNEADIIEQVVGDLITQGIQIYFLDDGSTDNTAAIVERFLGLGVLAVERCPARSRDAARADFEWERILLRKTALAKELDADWFIHHDADEFRESPWPHLTLKDAIQRVDALGFNAIDFTSLDFWPVDDRFRAGDDVREALPLYAEHAPYDRVQIRCWKKTGDLDLSSTGGHEARFPDRRVFPLRFILRHYPIRGQEHGDRKVFQERQNRFLEGERARGWHIQYDAMQKGASFLRDPATLTPYDPDAVRIALALRHRGIEALEASLKEAQSAVEMRRRELESSRNELEGTSAELGARSVEARNLRGEVDRRVAELAELCKQLTARNADATALRHQLETQAAELLRTQEDFQAVSTELAARSAELSARCADLDGRNTELLRAQGDFQAVSAQLATRTGKLEARDADLRTRATELRARNAEIARLQAILEDRAVEIANWKNSVADLTARLDAFHRSLSWRWTSPVRAAFRLFRGPR